MKPGWAKFVSLQNLKANMQSVEKTIFEQAWLNSKHLGLLALVLLGAFTAMAQPANDDFANYGIISGAAGQITGNNTNATLEAGEPTTVATGTGNVSVGASIWYQWTATSSDNVTFDTMGSS